MQVTKTVKIGITAQSEENLFGNGLKQNVWFLYRLLKNAGYDIHLVSESEKHYGKKLLGIPVEKLDTMTVLDYKVIIQCANSLTETCRKILRGHGGKVGSCEYGNKILIDMGTMIYGGPGEDTFTMPDVDFYWTSPHFERTMTALSTLSKAPVSICPYIWSPEIITQSYMRAGYNVYFGDHTNTKNIAIMESNLYIVKTCFIPMLISEKLYSTDPDLIDGVFNVGAERLKEKKNFLRFCNKLDLVKEKKMSFEGRWALNFLLHKGYAGTILSHQWCNELNYLQLEAMYLNLPFVHNSPTFEEHGYYYPGFDVDKGAEALKEAITEHPKRYLEDRKKNEELMWRYNPNNKVNVDGYIELMEEVISTIDLETE